MARKQLNVSRGTLFATLLTASFILLLLPRNITKDLNFFFLKVCNPILSIGRKTPAKVFRRLPITEEFVPRSEHNELWKVYKNTHARMMRLQKQCEKLARFRVALPKPGPGLIHVEVINVSINSFGHELFVNKGSIGGLRPGQYVLSGNKNAIVGTVFETTDTRAKIRLLTDANHRIEIKIWREGKTKYLPAQMIGDGKSACKILLIPRDYNVKAGDTVYAAARPGTLEVPVVIGEVTNVKPDQMKPLLWDITVKPVENLNLLTDAAVIVTDPIKDTENEN